MVARADIAPTGEAHGLALRYQARRPFHRRRHHRRDEKDRDGADVPEAIDVAPVDRMALRGLTPDQHCDSKSHQNAIRYFERSQSVTWL